MKLCRTFFRLLRRKSQRTHLVGTGKGCKSLFLNAESEVQKKEGYKVRNHNPLISEYREATHQNCNFDIKPKASSCVAILLHKVSGYDCFFIFGNSFWKF